MSFTVTKLRAWDKALDPLTRESRSLPGVPEAEERKFQAWVDWMADRMRHREISSLVAWDGGRPCGLLGYHRNGEIIRVHYLYLCPGTWPLSAFLLGAEEHWRPWRRIIVEGGPQTLLDEAVGPEGFLEAGYHRFERARLERWLDETFPREPNGLIQPLPITDITALVRLQLVGYLGSPDYLLVDDFEVMVHELLGDPWFAPDMSYAVREGEDVVAALYTFLKARMAWIASLCVDPAARGRGYGRKLMQHALSAYAAAGYRRVGLHVTLGNAPATRLYEQMGFTLAQRKSLLYVKDRSPLP